ncbi:MAG: SUMF1/EgtB/PvdO family nonheme iron enzyme [Deltaproteobacteria bacterium]|nr:SUMF1/EgtB/PvdO family nonheme iron enzyme [Deltaproteobacteria bacterium]
MRRRSGGLAVALAWVSLGEALAQPAPARQDLDLGGVALTMVRVPRGTFTQGSDPTVRGRGEDEGPRAVEVTRDFYVGEAPVSRGQFARFADTTGYRTEAEVGTSGGSGLEGGRLVQRAGFSWRSPGFAQSDEHPVVLVTATDAERFLAWASGVTGRRLRLPTEAEWELACRGGGEAPDARDPAPSPAPSRDGTTPARSGTANGLGLYGLLGQVHQWTADIYGPYGPSGARDPWTLSPPPGEPARRVLRGASFLREGRHWRCAARSRNTPGTRNADNGFRVAMGVDAPAPVPVPLPLPVPNLDPPQPTLAPDEAPDHGADSALLCVVLPALALALAALALLAAVLLRRGTAVPLYDRSGRRSGMVRVRSVGDGLWVRGDAGLHGTPLRITWTAAGRTAESDVVYEHSSRGQFVYTGLAKPAVQRVVHGDRPLVMVPGPGRTPRRQHHGPHASHSNVHSHTDTHSSHMDVHAHTHYDPPAY